MKTIVDMGFDTSLADVELWSPEYARGWCEGYNVMAKQSWMLQIAKETQIAKAVKYDGWERVVADIEKMEAPRLDGEVEFVRDGRLIFTLDCRSGTMSSAQ